MIFLKKQSTLLLIAILAIGVFLRFYKLDWGDGLFTHPDEYHIAASVNQLSFPAQMHPHFFSYGTVTIYLIYFTQELINSLSSTLKFDSAMQNLIPNSFILGRFYSALFSSFSIIIVYKICRSFMERRFSYLAALLTALTPGLIQQAHFATPESALTFFLFGSLIFIIKFLKQNKILFLVLASVFLGFALGVKISSVVFLLPLVLSIILSAYFKRHSGLSRISNHLGDSGCAAAYQNDAEDFRSFRKLFRLIILIVTSLIVIIITFALVAPFVFLDFPDFRGNFEYEGGLAIGKIPVFYTRQFIDTIPVLFQIEKVLPYALGPALLVFGIFGLFLVMYKHLGWWQADPERSRRRSHDSSEVDVRGKILFLVTISFLSLFLTNAFLFAKWTRFIAPTFPFFAIFSAFLLEAISKPLFRHSGERKRLQNLDSGQARMTVLKWAPGAFLLFGTLLWTMAFLSIYTNRDIRITASKWLESTALPGSTFLVEGGNMIDIPLAGNFQRTSLSFYDLEDDPLTRERIIDTMQSSDYFLIQSRRVFYNHQRLRHLYPKTSRFYDALFNGKMGFEQIKEFHSYPKLSFFGFVLEFPDETAEETWSVFDHPVIRIFEKKVQLTKEDYAKFLEE